MAACCGRGCYALSGRGAEGLVYRLQVRLADARVHTARGHLHPTRNEGGQRFSRGYNRELKLTRMLEGILGIVLLIIFIPKHS